MRTDLKILLIGALSFLLLLLYFYSPADWHIGEISVKKASFSDLTAISSSGRTDKVTDEERREENIVEEIAKEKEEVILSPDTTSQRILFFGDSMVDYLGRAFASYAEQNGHSIENIIWFSSTTQHWAETDTLQHFIRKYDPTYVVICLGGNEIFTKDLDRRKEWVKRIQKKIGERPYVWISPPNWKPVYAFTDMIRETVGEDRFFDSTHLIMERGSDHAHPTYKSAEGWMDTVAAWMQSPANRHPIILEQPERKAKSPHLHVLSPYTMP